MLQDDQLILFLEAKRLIESSRELRGLKHSHRTAAAARLSQRVLQQHSANATAPMRGSDSDRVD